MSTMSPAVSAQGGPRASFFQRLAAYLIDVILIGIVEGIVWAIAGQSLGVAAGLVVGLAYFSYFEGGDTGQTLGKRALGIRVYDFSRGGADRLRAGVRAHDRPVYLRHRVRPRLPLDAVGRREADLARQDRDDRRRADERLPSELAS